LVTDTQHVNDEIGGTGTGTTDYRRSERSATVTERPLPRRRRPAKPTSPSRPRSPQLPESFVAVRVGGGSATCPGGAPGAGVPGGACASATAGDTTATMAARRSTIAHTVRLRDANIMGLPSIHLVHTRERSASLYAAAATAGNEPPEEEHSRQPAAQGLHGLSAHVPSCN
jgi:hypothetical protein